MPLERLAERQGTYRDVDYELKVYYSPESAYSDDERLVIVETTCFEYATVESVHDSTPLNPTQSFSFLPWRDSNPDPLPKEDHIQRALARFKSRVDEYRELKEKASQ